MSPEGRPGSVKNVSHLRWMSRPVLRQPIVIAAFEGWNDAGEAATQAVAHLAEVWDAQPFAEIDPEEFYDFTTVRPQVRIDGGDLRRIEWPANRFSHAVSPHRPDLVLLGGVEPQLRWRTFCGQILDVAETIGARLVLTLGALLADVPHSRPTAVFGTAYEARVIEALHLEPSQYEGPTGVVGVLHAEARQRGINSASLWAAVPSYVAAAPCPKAALALVERVGALLGIEIAPGELREAAVAYEAEITELVAEDEDTEAYVRHLEQRHDDERSAVDHVDALVAEVERFLREH